MFTGKNHVKSCANKKEITDFKMKIRGEFVKIRFHHPAVASLFSFGWAVSKISCEQLDEDSSLGTSSDLGLKGTVGF